MQRKRASDRTTGPSKTIFEEILESSLPPEEKTLDRLMDEGLILIGAGGETTAQTLAVLTFNLLHNPPVLQKLRKELDDAIPDPANMPSWQQLEQLPYLVSRDPESKPPFPDMQPASRHPRATPHRCSHYFSSDSHRTRRGVAVRRVDHSAWGKPSLLFVCSC